MSGTINTFTERMQVNTGKSEYSYNPGIAIGGFLAPLSNSTLTAENMADIANFINAQLHHDDPLKRWQIVGPYEDVEDQSEEAQVQTLGYGRKIVTDRGYQGVKYPFLEGGKDYANKLIQYNGLHEFYRYFEVDINGVMIGTVVKDETTGAKQNQGLSLSMLHTHDMKRPTRSTVPVYAISLGFADPAELNEKVFAIKLPETLRFRNLKAVQDLMLENITPAGAATGVFTVGVFAGSGNSNFAANSTLSTAMANSTRWIVTRKDNGAVIPTSGVTVNGTKTGFALAMNTAHANYTVGAKAYIDVASVSTLATAGIKWYTNPNPKLIEVTLT